MAHSFPPGVMDAYFRRCLLEDMALYGLLPLEDEDEDLPPQPPQAKLNPEDFG